MSTKNLSNLGVLYTERRDFYLAPNVVKELWTDVTPFTTVVANQQTLSGLKDPLFKMFEHRNPWIKQRFAFSQTANNGAAITLAASVNGASPAASGDIPIDTIVGLASTPDSSYVGLQCEVRAEATDAFKGVCLIVEASAAGVKVKNLSAADFVIAATDYAIVVGNAFGEGTSSPEAWADELGIIWNSTQIFKTAVEITGTLQQAALRGESSELARLRLQKNQEHKMQKEKAFLFGSSPEAINGTFGDSKVTDKDGNRVRLTQGIVSAINRYGTDSGDSRNKWDFSGGLTYNSWVDMTEKMFQYLPESGVKRAFCGLGAISYFSKLQANATTNSLGIDIGLTETKRDTLGFNFRNVETPHGVIQLIPTPALRGAYNKTMVVVSEENLFHAQYRPPVFQANIKTDNGYDGVKDQYMSDEGIGMTLLESHHIITTP